MPWETGLNKNTQKRSTFIPNARRARTIRIQCEETQKTGNDKTPGGGKVRERVVFFVFSKGFGAFFGVI